MHIATRQHRFIGFLKFWRLPLNIIASVWILNCMVYYCVFWFGCVSSNSVLSATGFNLSRTINFLISGKSCFSNEYAIIGDSGKMDISVCFFVFY